MSVADYINADMNQKIMKKITLKAMDSKYIYKSYKVRFLSLTMLF